MDLEIIKQLGYEELKELFRGLEKYFCLQRDESKAHKIMCEDIG